MVTLAGRQLRRYELVQAAHHFILTALPFRFPDSARALSAFVDIARRSDLWPAELEQVLLSLLATAEPHAHGRLPTLIQRFRGQRRDIRDPIARFEHCVDELFRFRGISSPEIHHAIEIVERRLGDSELTQSTVAESLGIGSQELSEGFRCHTGLNFAQYLKEVRLDRSAQLLVTTRLSVKQVWAAVGYNDHSNFCHHFRSRFGCTPREYRTRRFIERGEAMAVDDGESASARSAVAVLVVDDDRGTRDWLKRKLTMIGYEVTLAETAERAILSAERLSPDVVIVDHHLPDMDGLACLGEIRRRSGNRRPAALIFTADWNVADEAEQMADLGAMFASKLSDFDEVEHLVASAVTARSMLRFSNGRDEI